MVKTGAATIIYITDLISIQKSTILIISNTIAARRADENILVVSKLTKYIE
jgi:hypothetical protein